MIRLVVGIVSIVFALGLSFYTFKLTWQVVAGFVSSWFGRFILYPLALGVAFAFIGGPIVFVAAFGFTALGSGR